MYSGNNGIPLRELLILGALILLQCRCSHATSEEFSAREPANFRIEFPTIQLHGVPAPEVRILALNADGELETEFSEQVTIQGLRLQRHGRELPLPPFEKGVLSLETDRSRGQTVAILGPDIQLALARSGTTFRLPVRSMPGWVSLIPPLLAILLAIWWQEVVGALLLACLSGMLLLAANPWQGFVQTIDPLFLSILSDPGNVRVILFTLFLGSMVGVMSGSGGTQALVDRLTRHVETRQHGQLTTWLLGLLIFFDDYSNTLLVGSTMRPITDRLRISREKLAFLVDATAAPVAGLALASTWVGVEIGYLQSAYDSVGLPTEEIFQVFVATIPYRFYPLLVLIFVGQIAWTGCDYGPMRIAEQNCTQNPIQEKPEEESLDSLPGRPCLRHALLPLLTLCLTLAIALWVDFESSSRALLLASAAAVTVAILSVVLSRSASLQASVALAIDGMKQMLPAVVVLVLAWSIGTVCNAEHLNTAGFLVEACGQNLSSEWMPAITFLLASVVSFATGTSYGTMGLLIPLCVAIEYQLLESLSFNPETIGSHPQMLATIGAVLGGAIFGDHCSPISDTTILSSAATGCDHLAHVRTQFPYAVTVGGIALGVGYSGLAIGIPPAATIPAAVALQWLILRMVGRQQGSPGENL